MAKRGRKPLLIPTIDWKCQIPVDVAAKVDLLLLDPSSGRQSSAPAPPSWPRSSASGWPRGSARRNPPRLPVLLTIWPRLHNLPFSPTGTQNENP